MPVVRNHMSRDLLTVDSALPLAEVAARMVEREVGAVLVLDGDRLVGILTERDVLRAVAHRTHSSEARVRQWMTREVVTVPPSMDADDAAKTMLDRNFRHLPVVDNGRPVGIVSMRDLTREALTD